MSFFSGLYKDNQIDFERELKKTAGCELKFHQSFDTPTYGAPHFVIPVNLSAEERVELLDKADIQLRNVVDNLMFAVGSSIDRTFEQEVFPIHSLVYEALDCHRASAVSDRSIFPRSITASTSGGELIVDFGFGSWRSNGTSSIPRLPDPDYVPPVVPPFGTPPQCERCGFIVDTSVVGVNWCPVSDGGRDCKDTAEGLSLAFLTQYLTQNQVWRLRFGYSPLPAAANVYGYKFWITHKRGHSAKTLYGEASQFGGSEFYYYAYDLSGASVPDHPTAPEVNDICAIELSASSAGDTTIVSEARNFRDELLLQSRHGYLVARKYYELSPDVNRFILKHPKKAKDLIEVARLVIDTTAKIMNPAAQSPDEPVLSVDRAQKIKAFLQQVELFEDQFSPNFRGHLTALKTYLILHAQLGGNYLTFGDLIRAQSGQLDSMERLGNTGWQNYTKHFSRKPNPHLEARLPELLEIIMGNLGESAAVAIQRPDLFAALINHFDGSQPKLSSPSDLAQTVSGIVDVSEDPEFDDALGSFASQLE